MLKSIPIAAFVMLAIPVLAAPAPSPELAQVQQHLRATTSMVANFTQTDRAGKVLTGVMTLKRPGKIRFQYEKGVPILIVADGSSLWFVDYSVGQQSRWPIGNSPLGVLIDPSKDITRFASVRPTANRDVVSVEAHDPRHPEYGRITLVFARRATAPGGLMLQGWVALDSQNNRTTIRLSDQRFGVPVGDATFRWRDPRKTGPRN